MKHEATKQRLDSEVFRLRLEAKLWTRAARHAAKEQRTMASLIRQALVLYLEGKGA